MTVKKKRGDKQATPYPVFTIRFTDGLAIRNRLPLDHVIRVLTEIRGMIEAAGKRFQRQRGAEEPTGDFGLEIIGGFKRGSVQAALAITKDTVAGVLAARQVLETVTRLSVVPKAKARKTSPDQGQPYDPRLVARLGNISKVQEIDKTRVEMRLVQSTGAKPLKAVFDRRTTQTINKLREPNFGVEELTLFGKLRELRDKYDEGEEKKAFFGELLADDGTIWRIEFKARDVETASSLFRKQVCITGDATYYKALNPKIVVKTIELDPERDYEAAFDELYGASPELAKVDLRTLVEELAD
jgi:hypothetical protein